MWIIFKKHLFQNWLNNIFVFQKYKNIIRNFHINHLVNKIGITLFHLTLCKQFMSNIDFSDLAIFSSFFNTVNFTTKALFIVWVYLQRFLPLCVPTNCSEWTVKSQCIPLSFILQSKVTWTQHWPNHLHLHWIRTKKEHYVPKLLFPSDLDVDQNWVHKLQTTMYVQPLTSDHIRLRK